MFMKMKYLIFGGIYSTINYSSVLLSWNHWGANSSLLISL